jgi:hypothetical protein
LNNFMIYLQLSSEISFRTSLIPFEWRNTISPSIRSRKILQQCSRQLSVSKFARGRLWPLFKNYRAAVGAKMENAESWHSYMVCLTKYVVVMRRHRPPLLLTKCSHQTELRLCFIR